ncbi:iron reductase [Gordonia oryzae]|uniref:Iron reductase n=1 Tax=Gordonia oryzae TaxID=2487349 RepID=A0A3N4G4I7_9ACTN|nr:ferric reductase-like transmembrane domain-containing protein [Gordonia oryzae]RPA57295.1 iron reductase [Gordonia oryzae]
MDSAWLWYFSRAAGVVTLLMFTGVLVLGVLTAADGIRSPRAATVITAVHRGLAMAAIVFLGVHVLTAVLDSYVHVGWWATLVPLSSEYQRMDVAFGTVAADLALAVIVSSLLRYRIPERWWRSIHWATYAVAVCALAHGLLMAASDTPVLTWITIGATALAALAVVWRLLKPARTLRSRPSRSAIVMREWT